MFSKFLQNLGFRITPPLADNGFDSSFANNHEKNSLKDLFTFILSRYVYVFSFSLINAYFIAYGISDFSNFILELKYAVLPALLLVAVFALCSPYNRYLEIFFYFYASIWNTITIFEAIVFKTIFNTPSLHIMLHTTKTEASGFLSLFLDIKILSITLLIWLIPLVILYISKNIKYSWNFTKKLSFVIASVLLLLLPVHASDNGLMNAINSRIGLKPPNIERNMRKVFWVFNATLIPKAMEISSFEANIPSDVTASIDGVQNVILFLSESGNRNQYSIYGYPRQTNPELEKFELIKYNDVISAKPVTWTSIPLMLTFANLKQSENYITSIHDLFCSAGFETFGYFGFPEINKNDLIYTIQNRANTFTIANEEYDKYILNHAIDVLKNNPAEKKFILIFTALTHGDYKKYYPHDYEEFNDTAPQLYPNSNERIRNEYDTAVKYLDKLQADFLREIQSIGNTIVLVSSDHGQEVGNSSTVFGHSSQMKYPASYEVPFFVYMTDDYKKNVKELVFETTRPYQSDNIIHSVIDLAGLKTDLHNPELSIFNKAYVEQKRYIHEEEYHILKARYPKAE